MHSHLFEYLVKTGSAAQLCKSPVQLQAMDMETWRRCFQAGNAPYSLLRGCTEVGMMLRFCTTAKLPLLHTLPSMPTADRRMPASQLHAQQFTHPS